MQIPPLDEICENTTDTVNAQIGEIPDTLCSAVVDQVAPLKVHISYYNILVIIIY